MRIVVLLLLTATLLLANTFRLYLKDGDYQSVREYKVEGDRVRYYSTERGDWEEIPLELCDIQKTENERQRTSQDLEKNAKLEDNEEKLERAQRKEAAQIPMETGAYFVANGQVKTLQLAEMNFITDKKRSVLQKLAPIPMVVGKATITLKGPHAPVAESQDLPEFYLRLEQEDKFGIIQLTPLKGDRLVEDVQISPITKENAGNPKQIATFQRELGSGLFKVWPQKSLTPGEYAVVEYVGADEDLRVWDFSYQLPPAN